MKRYLNDKDTLELAWLGVLLGALTTPIGIIKGKIPLSPELNPFIALSLTLGWALGTFFLVVMILNDWKREP